MPSDQSVETANTGRENETPPIERLKCGRVADLINLAEIQICGPNHIGTSAFAEGLARLGDRSASRLDDARPLAMARHEPVPCVYHCFSGNDVPVPYPASVVLVAGTHQDAVDHCLVAQQIAEDLRVPVHCLVDSALQDCLSCVELPRSSTFKNVSPDARVRKPVTADSLAACFESASTSLGRLHQPVLSFGPVKARQVLVACGCEAALARTLLDHGCFSPETRLLQVQMLRPLPTEELCRQLDESEQVVFLTRQDDPLNAELLAALEVLAAGDRKFLNLSLAPLTKRPLTEQDLLNALPVSFVEKGIPQPSRTTPFASLQLQIGATPGGRWSRELLVESASAIIRTISTATQRNWLPIRQDDEQADSILSKLTMGVIDQETDSLDLLFYTENNLVDPVPALRNLKPNGILILNCDSQDIARVWRGLSAESKQLILDKKIETWWIRPWDLLDASGDIADLSCHVLNGAVLRTLSARLDLGTSRLENAPLSILEKAGAQAVRKFNPADQIGGQTTTDDEPRPTATNQSPQIPSNDKQWRQALRAFHLTGAGANNQSEPLPGLPLWPALATKLIDDHPIAAHYPFILPSPGNITQQTDPVSLFEALQSPPPGADGESSSSHEDLEQTVCKIEKVLGKTASAEISEVVASALKESSPENGDGEDDPSLRGLLLRIPKSGRLVGFGPDTLTVFYSWAAATQRRDLENRFYAEVEELMIGMQDLLQVDLSRRKIQRAPEALASTMGQQATAFVDLDKLSRNLPDVCGSEILSDSLLELIRETLGVLQAFHATKFQTVPFYLISSGEGPKFADLPATAQFVTSDCFETALGLVDGLLERMARVFRAMRVARLVISGRYEPEKHDEVFSRFQWQSCNDQEILLVPTVLVVETSTGIKNKRTTESLNRLLRSGRPVHVLITHDESGFTDEELSGALEDFSAIAMADREAFVFQSTLARPDHLLSGLRQMVQTMGPSIAFVSSHPTSQPGTWAWASELLSHYGRVAPCFRYSPDLGPSWWDRIDISGNPQIEASHPIVHLACNALPVASEKIDESVTFAHAASLRPDFRQHFRVIPRSAWSNDQQPIGAYLEKFESIPPTSLPYIWIVRNAELCRAIMTREMANACRDRRRAWRGLQELALINSEFANKAREEVRRELETHYQNETENARAQGRQEGTAQAVNRIVQALLGQTTPVATSDVLKETSKGEETPREITAPSPAKPPETSKAPKKPEPPSEPQAAPSSKPYIDTELCTSCNDCLKINPLLFVYDANNQAEIGDPSAGSFVELVKAAEKCPARCIHPGSPRADDKSATPAVVKRASKFP